MYYRKKVIYVPVRRKKTSRKYHKRKSTKRSFRRYKKW